MLEASGGSPEKPVGRVAFYSGQESDGPFLTSNFYKTLRPAGDVDPKFLHWALLRFYRQPDILQYQQQTTGIINLKFQDYLDAKVRSPVARKEQKLIADILDTLDIQIQKTEALIAKLEKVKEGLLHDLLTRGIDENGQLRPSPEQTPELYKDSPLGLIPREWCTACLSEISEKITDGTHQAVKTIAADETSVPFLYVSCVRNGKILWDQAAAISRSDFLAISKGREPHRGMILYTAVGSYGHAAAVEKESHFSFQRHISCISLKSKRAEPRFLSYFLNSPRSKRHADQVALGNAQKTVTLGELSGYPVTLPSIDEQEKISNELSKVDLKIDTLERALVKLKKQKIGLMDDLLTGRVRVTSLLDKAQATTPA